MNDVTQTEPLAEPPVAGSEVDTLLGALERNRRTFAWKCGGLDAAGLKKQHPPSTVSEPGVGARLMRPICWPAGCAAGRTPPRHRRGSGS